MGVDVSANKLKGTSADEEINNSLIHYVLSYDTNEHVGFYWPYGTGSAQGVGAFTNKAGKAYLELGEQSASVIARRGFSFNPQAQVPTDLLPAAQTDETQGQKLLRNGQLLILRNGLLFNAQGARIQ